ncbi:RHS repeat domain-containing protein, partial [Chryseobacterium limigenitum]
KDHLGNNRVSFGRNSAGALEITDANDYYPFGMNHLKSGNAYFAQGSYKSYKYQGQELQETGFYSFKWRNYMPDVGRFFNIDPLAEKFPYNSTYAFSENAVISYRELEGLEKVLAIFFTGGFRGEGKSTTEVNKHTQTPLALYNKVAEMGRANGVDVAGGVYQTTNEGLGRNAAANNASEFVQNNYQEGDKVVAFGFSHGGNQVVEFNDKLADMGIKTDASVIVDSSGGGLGNSIVKTTVNNSEYVMNIFQPNANEGQSHGEKMKPGEGVGRMVNFNADVPNKPLEVEHSNILNKQQPLILNIFNKQVEAAATEKNKKGN